MKHPVTIHLTFTDGVTADYQIEYGRTISELLYELNPLYGDITAVTNVHDKPIPEQMTIRGDMIIKIKLSPK